MQSPKCQEIQSHDGSTELLKIQGKLCAEIRACLFGDRKTKGAADFQRDL